MRSVTDMLLLAALAVAIYGANDPDGAADMLRQTYRALWPLLAALLPG